MHPRHRSGEQKRWFDAFVVDQEPASRLKQALREPDCSTAERALGRALVLDDIAARSRGEADEDSAKLSALGDAARKVIAEALGLFELAGRSLRRERLQARSEALAKRCPTSALARGIATLLREDAQPLNDHTQRFRHAVNLKRRVAAGGLLGASASVRLVSWCERRFRDAARAAPRHQNALLNRCLYPLFEAEPLAYVSALASQRPPDPPWTVFQAELDRRLRLLDHSPYRRWARARRAADARFFGRAQSLLPATVATARLALREVSSARPFDRQPVAWSTARGFLIDGLSAQLDDQQTLEAALRRRLQGDARAEIIAIQDPTKPIGPLLRLARAGHRVGVHTMLLGVGRVVARHIPAGDVYAKVQVSPPLRRLEGLPVSLRMYSHRHGPVDRRRRRGRVLDPDRLPSSLALSISPGTAVLSSSDGTLLRLDTPQWHLRRAELASALRLLRSAYPEDRGLLLAASAETPFGQLLDAVVVVRQLADHNGPLFPAGLALVRYFSISPETVSIRQLVARLALARVDAPGASALFQRRLGRCYRAALRAAFADSPESWAFELTLPLHSGTAAHKPHHTPHQRSLLRCTQGLRYLGPPLQVAFRLGRERP